jgi:hypothetical protein
MITPAYSPKAKYANALRPGTHEQGIGINKRIKRPSPLATAHVIMAEESQASPPSASQPEVSPQPISLDPDQETIRHLQDLNKASTQSDQIDEATISKLIEKNQASILSGTTTRAPANFQNQNIVSRAIESNELTIHSIPLHSAHSITETATYVKLPENPSAFKAYVLYVVEANHKVLAWLGLAVFLLLPVIRLISGNYNILTEFRRVASNWYQQSNGYRYIFRSLWCIFCSYCDRCFFQGIYFFLCGIKEKHIAPQ